MFHYNILGSFYHQKLCLGSLCDSQSKQNENIQIGDNKSEIFKLSIFKLNKMNMKILVLHTYHPGFVKFPFKMCLEKGTPMFSLQNSMDINFIKSWLSNVFLPPK
jgi:hypothetical protein